MLNTLWHKIWADLRQSKSRFLLAVISIAVGVFCVGTLFGMIDLLLSKMDAAHRNSQPSHISLILRSDADHSLLEKIKALPGVAGVDSMTPITVRFKHPGDAEWTMGTVIIRPDYAHQHFDKTVLQTGHWPSDGQLAIENLSAPFSGLSLGNRVEIATNNSSAILDIDGIVRHPFVKPPKFGGHVHFFAETSAGVLFGVKPNSFRQLLVQTARPYNAEHIRSVASNIRRLLAEQQIAVNVTLLQDPEQHWGRPFLAGINDVLQIMALVSLALASVLILNTVSAHISQQTEQIGVMKALGAKTATIAKLYVSEVLLIALAAIVIAAPPALAAAYFASCKLLAIFNIACGSFTISNRSLSLMLLSGLLAPLLAALGPILQGATMNVRVAMASYGLGGDFGQNRLDLYIERLGAAWLPTLHATALGNLFRRKTRLLLTQSVLIIAGVMFMALMSLIASLNLTLDNEMARSRYSVKLGFSVDQPEAKITEIANTLAATTTLEVWQRLPMEMSKNGKPLQQKGSLGAQLLALPSGSDLYQPLIESGRWLKAEDAGQRVLLISADTAELNGIQVGEILDVSIGSTNMAWQVIGIYRWLAGSNYSVEPVYAPLETVRDLTKRQNMASFALIDAAVSNLSQETDYLRQLKQRFQDQAIKLDVYSTQAKLEQRQFARNQFQPVLGSLLGLASMIAAVGAIGLSGALAISVLQRTREIGVLRAIGAPSKAIFRLFLLEGLLHGIVAWLLSAPLAFLIAKPLAERLGKTMLGIELDFAFDVKAVFYWLGIVLLLAWLAAYWPARKASTLTIRESLGH